MAKKRFGTGDMVVYPAHGVGKIEAVEAQEIAGMPLELYVIRFDDDRMTLKVPVIKAEKAGMRALSTMVEI